MKNIVRKVIGFVLITMSAFMLQSANAQVNISFNVNSLPVSYHVDLYRTYKVVINEKRPYMNHSMYKAKYGKYKHSYNKQSPNRDHPNRGNANHKGNNSNGKSSPQKKGGKGNKGK